MSEEKMKKRKKKHKSKDTDYDLEFDADDIDRTVKAAMRKVDKAMEQMKLVKSGSTPGVHDSESAGAGIGDCNFTATKVTNSVHNHFGTYINIQGSKNIQVGNNNFMVVNSSKKKSNKKEEAFDVDDYDDEDGNVVHRNASREEEFAKEEEETKDPSEMTETERKFYDLTHSDRLVNDEDFRIVCDNVGNWRRFFRLLGLDDPFLEQLQQDFHIDGVKEILAQGLRAWKQSMGKKATLGQLTSTLHRIGYVETLQRFNL